MKVSASIDAAGTCLLFQTSWISKSKEKVEGMSETFFFLFCYCLFIHLNE